MALEADRPPRFLGRRSLMATVALAGLLLLVPIVLLLAWALSGDSPRQVSDKNLLPLSPGLALAGGPREHCPQGAEPVGDCELYATVRGEPDPVGLLVDHLERRGWAVSLHTDGSELAFSGRKGGLCVEGRTPKQMEAKVLDSHLPPVDYVEGLYALDGGLPAALAQPLVFVTIGYDDDCRSLLRDG